MKKMNCRLKKGKTALLSDGKTALELSFSDDEVAVCVYTDFKAEPLVLRAAASDGDMLTLALYPYRLELYINDVLCDEEWEAGSLILGDEYTLEGNHAISVTPLENELPRREPRSCMTISGCRAGGVNVGDCMPFSENADGLSGNGDSVYHLFYLYDRHHHFSKWCLGAHQWAHISTEDFVTWREHPMAIPITHPWEGSICTGSIVFDGEKYCAWYAVRMSDRSPARITMAVSHDLETFFKTDGYFTLPPAYESRTARDPKVIFIDGRIHMLVTTSRVSDGRGCLAHLVSDSMTVDGNAWYDMGTVIVSDSEKQPECPDWFRMGEYYYITYAYGGKSHYAFSHDRFGEGGWNVPENNLIPCGNVPKSALFGHERIFAGFAVENVGGYAGDAVFVRAVQRSDGTLEFLPFPDQNTTI